MNYSRPKFRKQSFGPCSLDAPFQPRGFFRFPATSGRSGIILASEVDCTVPLPLSCRSDITFGWCAHLFRGSRSPLKCAGTSGLFHGLLTPEPVYKYPMV